MAQRVAVVGGGGWGTSLANLLAGKGYTVHLWVHDKDLAVAMQRQRFNEVYLPGVRLVDGITVTPSLPEAVSGVGVLLSALPSQAVRRVVASLPPLVEATSSPALMVSASKGIEQGTGLTPSQVMTQLLPPALARRIAVLSGPTFAREVANGLPTAVTVAAREPGVAAEAQRLLMTPLFRVYTSQDVLGVELGGALKNVIAIAAGICDGLALGHNTRAALMTRGLAEITRLGQAMGAQPQTFAGLSGMGDLVLTCTGDLSRNRQVGRQLAQGLTLQEIVGGMRMVAEGIDTTKAAVELGRRFGIELPITERVYGVLFGGEDPKLALAALMGRESKWESSPLWPEAT